MVYSLTLKEIGRALIYEKSIFLYNTSMHETQSRDAKEKIYLEHVKIRNIAK